MCASVVTHPHTRGANALAAREVTIGPLGLAGTLHLPASASALTSRWALPRETTLNPAVSS